MELCNPDLRWTDFKFVRLHINLDIAHKQRPSGWPDPKMIARKQAQVCVVYHQYRRLVCKCVAKDDCVMKMSQVRVATVSRDRTKRIKRARNRSGYEISEHNINCDRNNLSDFTVGFFDFGCVILSFLLCLFAGRLCAGTWPSWLLRVGVLP